MPIVKRCCICGRLCGNEPHDAKPTRKDIVSFEQEITCCNKVILTNHKIEMESYCDNRTSYCTYYYNPKKDTLIIEENNNE